MGVTLVPRLSVPEGALEPAERAASTRGDAAYVRYIPFAGAPPTRRVVLAWRRSFPRYEAIAALRNAVYACELPGCRRLT
jgi:LysR family hydrogen peroxide-inducible transcriptional activator